MVGGEPSRLGPEQRQRDLARMEGQVFDVVVVGGGITGAGAALDAAARGLSAALVEWRDFGWGTSGRSSNLIHGGLRYLEQLRFGLVRQALREQTLLLTRTCPFLVRPVPFLYPLRHRLWERPYVGAGLALYDSLGGRRALPGHRHLSRRGALREAPSLRPDRLVGAVRYWDARTDDARLTLAVARTAARHGAAVASRARVVGFLRRGARVSGVRVEDLEGGRQLEVRARSVINATGVWADDVEAMAGRPRTRLRVSKGVHLVVPRDRIEARTGLILRAGPSVLLVIPWDRHWVVGTTDTPWTLDKAHPVATDADVAYVLDHLNAALVRPLGREDVTGVYAGLRPLLAGDSAETSRLSRRHAVTRPVPGLVTVTGGKLTTYRAMAAEAVDAAGEDLGGRLPPSPTASTPLVGTPGFRSAWERRDALARRAGLEPRAVARLLWRYGGRAGEVLDLVAERPDLGSPLEGAGGYLGAEVLYAVTHEGALHLEDVLDRRTRISMEAGDGGMQAAPAVARLMAEALGWDPARVALEVARYGEERNAPGSASNRARHPAEQK